MPEPGRARLAALVSGAGSNLEAILQAQEAPDFPAKVVVVVSSRAGVMALERANRRSIPAQVLERRSFLTDMEYDHALLKILGAARTDLICLAGYLRKIGPAVIEQYRGRILNIHPALLPQHGGAGMWGHHVHEAVLAAREPESGCTVHLVDEEFDHGEVLAQARVRVLPNDTFQTLAARVLEQEHQLYPKAIKQFCEERMHPLKRSAP